MGFGHGKVSGRTLVGSRLRILDNCNVPRYALDCEWRNEWNHPGLGSCNKQERAQKSAFVSFNHGKSVWGVIFAPDSETFASASYRDETVCVWKGETGEMVLRPLKVNSEVNSVSHSPDGIKLTAGINKHIIIGNTETGEELLKIIQRAWRVAFTPDGLRLVCGNLKDIRISDVATGDIIKQFDAHCQKLSPTNHRSQWFQIGYHFLQHDDAVLRPDHFRTHRQATRAPQYRPGCGLFQGQIARRESESERELQQASLRKFRLFSPSLKILSARDDLRLTISRR
jgi:WD40 repeat protein